MLSSKSETRVREKTLFERQEERLHHAEKDSEFVFFRQFWVLLLSKVPERIDKTLDSTSRSYLTWLE